MFPLPLGIVFLTFAALSAAFRLDRSPFLISEHDQNKQCPDDCPHRDRQKPVCGSDGKIYKSMCSFQKAKCNDPSLEVQPRSRCSGVNVMRCQKDRAHAISRAKTQADNVYIPECNEDGSFVQVQCHKKIGYCWCVTAEGKPIIGTSVRNQTPNCTGTFPVRTSLQDPTSPSRVAFEFFSSLNAEEGVKPKPTPEVYLHSKAEDVTMPSFWITNLFSKDSKLIRTPKRPQDYSPSCQQNRQDAIEEAKAQPNEGAFIPECEADGRYKLVQCHQTTGYCFCVREDTGRPIPGTSIRSGHFLPDCTSDTEKKNAEMRTQFKDRALPGCPGPKKTEFLSTLVRSLTSDMVRHTGVMHIPFRRLHEGSQSPTLEEKAVRWHFVRLDKDFNNNINEKEIRPLKTFMKKHAMPKRCIRKFMEYCDLNSDNVISLQEMKGCLGLS
ncbi:SPARC-related modular calcium-binding protein 1-like isoform X2 [Protopterus annectens]|uniref:SPARC-related modular calcium-binding protein 1-like isoform X2 n=1 Tax=Protopterus annectens TaxID=7888 RepID=UPI001CFBE44D|nr:SPARC-related modular calcium-binding protein 1-like isoform X2 [Protopterus annectens]